MFRHYHMRSASGDGVGGARTPSSRTPSLTHHRTASSGSSRGATPTAAVAQVFTATNPSRSTGAQRSTPSDNNPFTTANHASALHDDDDNSLEQPISAGIRRPRDTSPDPTQLSPRRVKRLKVYAKKLCQDDEQIPQKPLLDFIESGNLFCMVVDVKASLLKQTALQRANEKEVLLDHVRSEEFKSSLHNRLVACILSPNLTAYVTDTARHIMEFIGENPQAFKVPPEVFHDPEARTFLSSLTSKLLATIRSSLRSQLTTSLVKKMCIIDVTRAIARTTSGMEVDATHWNRMAFLRRCLRIFLIGNSEYQTATLEQLYTPHIVPMLKSDMCYKLTSELGIDTDKIKDELLAASADHADLDAEGQRDPGAANPENGAWQDWGTGEEDSLGLGGQASLEGDNTQDGPTEEEEDEDELEEGDSGFGLVAGKHIRWTTKRFWDFVDYMLKLLRNSVRKTAGPSDDVEKNIGVIMIQILQEDLLDCPGSRKGMKLLSNINPEWQMTIQEKLIW